jgi:hypothetical protein
LQKKLVLRERGGFAERFVVVECDVGKRTSNMYFINLRQVTMWRRGSFYTCRGCKSRSSAVNSVSIE